jgi:hypothetical protein
MVGAVHFYNAEERAFKFCCYKEHHLEYMHKYSLIFSLDHFPSVHLSSLES